MQVSDTVTDLVIGEDWTHHELVSLTTNFDCSNLEAGDGATQHGLEQARRIGGWCGGVDVSLSGRGDVSWLV